MNKIAIIFFAFLFIIELNAQQHFGNAIFTVPEGWKITETKETVTLEKTSQTNVTCKIIITATEKGVVTTDVEYVQFRSKNSDKDIIFPKQKGAVTKYEGDGLVSFYSRGTTTQNMIVVNSYFYTLSNGSQTFSYQLLTSNNECIKEFNEFMTTLKMELDTKDQINAKARKAAPAAPAAPAPMM